MSVCNGMHMRITRKKRNLIRNVRFMVHLVQNPLQSDHMLYIQGVRSRGREKRFPPLFKSTWT